MSEISFRISYSDILSAKPRDFSEAGRRSPQSIPFDACYRTANGLGLVRETTKVSEWVALLIAT